MECVKNNLDAKQNSTQEMNNKFVSWEKDYQSRMNPGYLTNLIHESVPVASQAGLNIEDVQEGMASLRLPLIEDSTNQHGTHQAALIALLGDYTGGIAVATLLRGVPVMGIHPIYGRDAMCLWLAEFQIKYISPSVTDLNAEAIIPNKNWCEIQDRFWHGKSNFIPVKVLFFDTDKNIIAIAKMTYYLKHSAFLSPRDERINSKGIKHLKRSVRSLFSHLVNRKPISYSLKLFIKTIFHPPKQREISVMYLHMLKSSARLIANIRGRTSSEIADKWSSQAAGEHGELLAKRFIESFPELVEMVRSRTIHCDQTVRNAYNNGIRQIILAGAGLDFRPWKMPEDIIWFELDLADMIQERNGKIEKLKLSRRNRISVVANLLHDDLLLLLQKLEKFDREKPCLILFEGLIMYFEPEDASQLLNNVSKILKLNRNNRLWMDLPTESVLKGDAKNRGAVKFLDSIAKLGEPFLFGSDNIEKLLIDHSMRMDACIDSGRNDVFKLYKFIIAKAISMN